MEAARSCHCPLALWTLLAVPTISRMSDAVPTARTAPPTPRGPSEQQDMLSPPGRGNAAFGFEFMRQSNWGDARSQRECNTRPHWVVSPCSPVQVNSSLSPVWGTCVKPEAPPVLQKRPPVLSVGPYSAALILGPREQETVGLSLGKSLSAVTHPGPCPGGGALAGFRLADGTLRLRQAKQFAPSLQEANPGLCDQSQCPGPPLCQLRPPPSLQAADLIQHVSGMSWCCLRVPTCPGSTTLDEQELPAPGPPGAGV